MIRKFPRIAALAGADRERGAAACFRRVENHPGRSDPPESRTYAVRQIPLPCTDSRAVRQSSGFRIGATAKAALPVPHTMIVPKSPTNSGCTVGTSPASPPRGAVDRDDIPLAIHASDALFFVL